MVNGWYAPQRAPNCARTGDVPPAVSTERGPVPWHMWKSKNCQWTELDQRAVDTVRVLAADAVQKVGNGHPGTAMSLAPAAYMLFQKLMRHDPADPRLDGPRPFRPLRRPHVSLTLYIQLYLAGYGLELEDLKAFRTWGSKTPGHPEYGHTDGRRDDDRPAGPGCRQRRGHGDGRPHERGLFDPEAPPARARSTTPSG